jgi:hypothetical protein
MAKKSEELLIIGQELGAITYVLRRFKAAENKLVLGATQSVWDAKTRELEALCRAYLDRHRASVT